LDHLDLVVGVGKDSSAGVPGWIVACHVTPVINERYGSGDECIQVPIERTDGILYEATDTSWIVLELLVHRVRNRARHEAAGVSDEGIGKTGDVAMKYQFPGRIGYRGLGNRFGIPVAAFMGVGRRHQGSRIVRRLLAIHDAGDRG
jgi:hypothetical protein